MSQLNDAQRIILQLLCASAVLSGSGAAYAEKLDCPAAKRIEATGKFAPANKKIGVSVAYLGVPFYANYKLGLEDGAKQFGFTYELMDGKMGDLPTEIANLQHFGAGGYGAVLLTPSGEGILPALKQLLDAKVPVIEVNNRAGFGKEGVAVTTYVGANDVEFGKLQTDMVITHSRQAGEGRLCHGSAVEPSASVARARLGCGPQGARKHSRDRARKRRL